MWSYFTHFSFKFFQKNLTHEIPNKFLYYIAEKGFLHSSNRVLYEKIYNKFNSIETWVTYIYYLYILYIRLNYVIYIINIIIITSHKWSITNKMLRSYRNNSNLNGIMKRINRPSQCLLVIFPYELKQIFQKMGWFFNLMIADVRPCSDH